MITDIPAEIAAKEKELAELIVSHKKFQELAIATNQSNKLKAIKLKERIETLKELLPEEAVTK